MLPKLAWEMSPSFPKSCFHASCNTARLLTCSFFALFLFVSTHLIGFSVRQFGSRLIDSISAILTARTLSRFNSFPVILSQTSVCLHTTVEFTFWGRLLLVAPGWSTTGPAQLHCTLDLLDEVLD